jgi:hypothetical protein
MPFDGLAVKYGTVIGLICFYHLEFDENTDFCWVFWREMVNF